MPYLNLFQRNVIRKLLTHNFPSPIVSMKCEKISYGFQVKQNCVFNIRDDSGLLFDKNKDRYQFENTKATFFERPPFSIKLRSDCTGKSRGTTA